MLGLYLHIPFCSSICSYCNFNRGLLDPGLKTRYVEALEREIRTAELPFPGDAPAAADTVFFGGGTPSLLDPSEVRRLIQACRDRFQLTPDAEITLETNPETANPARLAAFREAGVNRISFGVQSFEDEELRRLDRIHSAARARDAVAEARQAGFTNLSFDLMLWLPGQSFSSWLRTVDESVALEPEHLSLYLLELYPNAPLKETMARATGSDGRQAPDDEAADMYLAGLERLEGAGLRQYEISNVARDGYRCRHNVKYWQSGDWWGFGCGAHSTVRGRRWRNVSGTEDFIVRVGEGRPVIEGLTTLSGSERFAEAMFTGLRMSEGVDCGEIAATFGADPWRKHGEDLRPFVDAGLVWRREGRLGLSRQGMLVANGILATFV
jgi:oxygen-independent coproporphyrinogen-3 oxidase